MGKGTKKKTVWRTFSFENGYTNGNDATAITTAAADTTNGFTVLHHHHHHHHNHHQHHHQKNENGTHDVTNRSSIPNGKLINSWRVQRCTDDDLADNDADDDDDYGDRTNGNDADTKLHHHHHQHHHTNGSVNGVMNGYATENGVGGTGPRSYFRRSTNSDNIHKYPLRMNGLRKSSAYFQENGGTRSEFHDTYENSTTAHSQFRSNRSSKGPPSISRHANYRKWDSRNGSFSINGTASSNYSRGFRKSHFIHSDEMMATTATAATIPDQHQPTESASIPIAEAAITTLNEVINQTDEHFHEAKNARNAGDSDKCHDNSNNGDGNSSQQLYDQTDKRHGKQQNKFNEDEYTRISTPRSEVLFKKGYLMRDKKYVGPTNTISMAPTTTSSSNDSGSVSVISNEETASYYSIQSMSPDDSNSTYLNGGNSSSTDSTSATYPNDGFEHDLSLIYSSGFYDNSGYFYVNPYIHNNFDQFNGPTILMPYGSAPTTTTPTATTKDADVYDTDAYPQTSLSPGTGDGKSIDSEQVNNFSSINSEEMSNSSLSINNDLDTPPNPLTPPPSPLSPNEKPITRAQLSDSESPEESQENGDEPDNDDSQNTVAAAPDGENITEPIADAEHEDVPDVDTMIPTDNYSMPYFSPLIFVPPIPFVPDARLANSRRGRFRRHLNNQYGRSKRNNRFTHFYNKVYIPSNWSEAPDEASSLKANADNGIESNEGKPVDGTPTIEQCDTILKNSKLNLNVSEFIPQSKRMILVPLSIASSPPASLYFVPIPSTESTLNVNVPEFLPKNYKPLNERMEENVQGHPNNGINKENDTNHDEDDNNNNNNNNNNRNGQMTISSTMINGNDTISFTNESSKNEKNNETTIQHTNDLSNDAKQMTSTPVKVTTTTTTKTGPATAAPIDVASANGAKESSHAIATRKANLANKQHRATAPFLSDLLKTNNTDNLNLKHDDDDDDDNDDDDAAVRSFNKEHNSHTNLKSEADLGNKKIITYNISKKVYKTDNHYSDSGSGSNNHKGHKLNHSSNNHHNNNNNNNNRHAYPKTKETSHKQQQQQQQQKTLDRPPVNDDIGDQKAPESVAKSQEKSSRTYAQMVVPMATTAVAAGMIKTPSKTTDTKVQANDSMMKTSKSSSPTTPMRGVSNNNRVKANHPSKRRTGNGSNNNTIAKKDDAKRKSPDIVEKPAISDGSVEWFTIDARGKKHRQTSNGSTVTEIAFENNESNIEKVNKIAEELLLDINKDADLAMDIMDSLTVQNDQKSTETKTKTLLKKKKPTMPVNKLKKKSKEKSNKEQQKRRDTFDIIEPSFGTNKPNEAQSIKNETEIEQNGTDAGDNINENDLDHRTSAICNGELNESLDDSNAHDNDDDDNDDNDNDDDLNELKELIFDPSVFATPCNLTMQMDSHQRSPTMVGPTALSKSSLLLSSGGKSVRNVFNQFNIYQSDFASYENQQLKQEEEMVIKVLQQLNNKSMETSEMMESDKVNVVVNGPDTPVTVATAATVEVVQSTSEELLPCNVILSSKSDDELTSLREDSVERFSINAKPYQNVYSSNHFLEHFFGDRNDKCDHVVDSNVASTSLSSSDQPKYVDENGVNPTVDATENFNTYPIIDANNCNDCNEMSIIELDESSTQDDEKTDTKIENGIIDCKSDATQLEQQLEIETNGQIEVDEIFEINGLDCIESQIKQSSECVSENVQEIHTLNQLNSDDKLMQMPQIDNETDQFSGEMNCTITATDLNGISNGMVECDAAMHEENFKKPELNSIESKMEACSIDPEPETESVESIVSCDQSVKSNSSNNERPWLRIVDTQTLEQEKKVQQTLGITSAVSMWLQAQKEKTPDPPLLRIPNYQNLLTSAATTKRTKINSTTSHSNSSIDLTEDDEEEDIMSFWESPVPQSPTPPPIYNSIYGTSINYTNLLKSNELLCNNIIDFDQIDVTVAAAATTPTVTDTNITNDKASAMLQNGFNQNAADTMNGSGPGKMSTDEKCYRTPPEVCCTIM